MTHLFSQRCMSICMLSREIHLNMKLNLITTMTYTPSGRGANDCITISSKHQRLVELATPLALHRKGVNGVADDQLHLQNSTATL